MKIKALASLCKQTKGIHLYEEGNDVQWIGDGYAMYPLYNMPILNKQNIFTIFDVPDSKRNDYTFREAAMPEGYSFSDIDDCERMLDHEGIFITRMGVTLQPLRTSQGIVFIDTDYLKPVADIKDTIELYERLTKSGRPYIAIKNGMLLVGIVQINDVIDKRFVEQMETLTKQCMFAYENKLGEDDKKK